MKTLNKQPHSIALAACSFELQAGNELQLFPQGLFRARDGRPHEVDAWQIDQVVAEQLIAQVAALTNPLPIDYEHQILHAIENGQPAPAAGWFKQLEWREGKGLFAVDVEWTEPAKAFIKNGEYRYVSPVFAWDRKTGEVTGLAMAAITNYPALDGMQRLTALATEHFSEQFPHLQQSDEDSSVSKISKALSTKLGLGEDATEEQAVAALTALQSKAEQVDGLEQSLTALKAESETKPDPAKYVPIAAMEDMKTQLTALSTQVNSREVEELVQQGLDEKKLLASQEEWATDLGKKDLTALKGYLKTAQPIAALSGTQTGGQPPEGEQQNGLTLDELAMCRATGIDPEEFKKTKGMA